MDLGTADSPRNRVGSCSATLAASGSVAPDPGGADWANRFVRTHGSGRTTADGSSPRATSTPPDLQDNTYDHTRLPSLRPGQQLVTDGTIGAERAASLAPYLEVFAGNQKVLR